MPGIECRMRPTRRFAAELERRGVVDPREQSDVCKMLDDLVSRDALAQLLDEALVVTTKGSGTIDLLAVADFVLQRLKEHQR
jgi:hypothetical protein